MSTQRTVTTAYASYVFSNIDLNVRSGGGCYSYKELADMVGLKPTQHFKRRIHQMVQMKVLVLCPAFTPRGGIENRFQSSEANYEGMAF